MQPEHKIIWTDKFFGDSYKLKFLVDIDKMTAGINYGRIRICTVRQTLTIEVMAQKHGTDHEIVVKSLARQRAYYSLVKLYLDFSMSKIDKKEYISQVQKEIIHLHGNEKKLYDIHLGILAMELQKAVLLILMRLKIKYMKMIRLFIVHISISRHCGQRKMK